jgi:tetratricopeptide (TPR) repeat protein
VVRDGVIRFLEERVKKDPEDVLALNRLSGEYLARARAAGDDADLARAAKAAERSLAAVPADVNRGGVAGRARASMALHRFADARDDARLLLHSDPDKPAFLGMLGDALLELGDYDEAADAYGTMEKGADEDDPVTQARLARLALVNGRRDDAGRHFVAAVQCAKVHQETQPELLAWALVQAGHFAFTGGDWSTAEARYRAALDVSPDDWPATDHLAELRAAQKRYDEAARPYEALAARVPRPEVFQALGDVYGEMGRAEDALKWRQKARDGYLAAAQAGSSHYNHHLAGLYSDSLPDPPEAVRWAKKDLEIRHSVYAYDALAWALYKAGQFADASAAMDKALARGTRDAHVLYHAGLIYARAGDPARGRDCLRQAGEVNPHFMTFHVHR